MNKRNLIKVILIIVIGIVLLNTYTVYASSINPLLSPDSWNPADDFSDSPILTGKAGLILNVINVIGVILSIIVLVILGLKYMLGSLEQKAEYKKSMIPYIIGIVLLTASTTIPNVIYSFVKNSGIL